MNHPCNLYLCNKSSCHSNKNGLPKYLYITKDGIFPYSLNTNKFVFFNNISNENIIDIENTIICTYKKSKEYLLLKKCFEKIYNESEEILFS